MRAESILTRNKLSFKTFITLLFYLSTRSLSNVEESALVGLSTKVVGEWRTLLLNAVVDWFIHLFVVQGNLMWILSLHHNSFEVKAAHIWNLLPKRVNQNDTLASLKASL